jgi:hypothetical protein
MPLLTSLWGAVDLQVVAVSASKSRTYAATDTGLVFMWEARDAAAAGGSARGASSGRGAGDAAPPAAGTSAAAAGAAPSGGATSAAGACGAAAGVAQGGGGAGGSAAAAMGPPPPVVPQRVPGLTRVAALAVGEKHTLALQVTFPMTTVLLSSRSSGRHRSRGRLQCLSDVMRGTGLWVLSAVPCFASMQAWALPPLPDDRGAMPRARRRRRGRARSDSEEGGSSSDSDPEPPAQHGGASWSALRPGGGQAPARQHSRGLASPFLPGSAGGGGAGSWGVAAPLGTTPPLPGSSPLGRSWMLTSPAARMGSSDWARGSGAGCGGGGGEGARGARQWPGWELFSARGGEDDGEEGGAGGGRARGSGDGEGDADGEDMFGFTEAATAGGRGLSSPSAVSAVPSLQVRWLGSLRGTGHGRLNALHGLTERRTWAWSVLGRWRVCLTHPALLPCARLRLP